MTAARPFLIATLRHVADGGTVDHAQLDAGVPDPLSLDSDEKDAWEELSHWADDDDIRERGERYAIFKRERMRDQIPALIDEGKSDNGGQFTTVRGRGCAVSLVCINVAAMGLLASSFASGPFSSAGQELWYRYGSIGFLLFGAIIPAGALLFGARRYPAVIAGATVWMLAIWLPFAGYLIMSGGGM
jgi:hypothetical protein